MLNKHIKISENCNLVDSIFLFHLSDVFLCCYTILTMSLNNLTLAFMTEKTKNFIIHKVKLDINLIKST